METDEFYTYSKIIFPIKIMNARVLESFGKKV
jgi:hypothetical protein